MKELIYCDEAPLSGKSFSQAIRLGDYVMFSAILPIDRKTCRLVEGDIKAQTKQVLDNIVALLKSEGMNTRHILRANVYMTDLKEYHEMDQVYRTYFTAPFPCRTIIGVNDLLLDAKVQIECFCIDTRALEVLCANEKCKDGCCSID